jgi:hypothetical protein
MTRKSGQRKALLSGADGFTLNETARLLGTEWNEETRHVARALLRALKKENLIRRQNGGHLIRGG